MSSMRFRCGPVRRFARAELPAGAQPSAVREYVFSRSGRRDIHANFLVGTLIAGFGGRTLYVRHDLWGIGFGMIGLGIIIFLLGLVANRTVDWTVTSDRIIERRGMLASNRREMELADIRSVEVSQRVLQRLLGLGNVTIASAASADFMVRLNHIASPGEIAETVRKARLKRLA